MRLKKISHLIRLALFKLEQLIFLMFEPFYRFIENKDPEVRHHLNQAFASINEKKQAIALLNLNMVLSLNPRHFLARLFRGRIYIKEGQYRLASEDYCEANKISQYRFKHYDLSQEYFRLFSRDFGGDRETNIENLDRIFETLLFQQNFGSRDKNTDMGQDLQERLAMMKAGLQEVNEFIMSPDETEKFMIMGPITQKEIEVTDWDQLADDLTT